MVEILTGPDRGPNHQEVARLRSQVSALHSALERAQGCINGLLARTPVRDVSETLAEINAALRMK